MSVVTPSPAGHEVMWAYNTAAKNAAGRLIDMIGDDGAESVVADMGMLSQAFEAALGAFSKVGVDGRVG